jgi:hypothetical protein
MKMLRRRPTQIELNEEDLAQLEKFRQDFFQQHLVKTTAIDPTLKTSYEEALRESREFLEKHKSGLSDATTGIAISQYERRTLDKDERIGISMSSLFTSPAPPPTSQHVTSSSLSMTAPHQPMSSIGSTELITQLTTEIPVIGDHGLMSTSSSSSHSNDTSRRIV